MPLAQEFSKSVNPDVSFKDVAGFTAQANTSPANKTIFQSLVGDKAVNFQIPNFTVSNFSAPAITADVSQCQSAVSTTQNNCHALQGNLEQVHNAQFAMQYTAQQALGQLNAMATEQTGFNLAQMYPAAFSDAQGDFSVELAGAAAGLDGLGTLCTASNAICESTKPSSEKFDSPDQARAFFEEFARNVQSTNQERILVNAGSSSPILDESEFDFASVFEDHELKDVVTGLANVATGRPATNMPEWEAARSAEFTLQDGIKCNQVAGYEAKDHICFVNYAAQHGCYDSLSVISGLSIATDGCTNLNNGVNFVSIELGAGSNGGTSTQDLENQAALAAGMLPGQRAT